MAKPPPLRVSDKPHAPVIYFELAPLFGHMNGIYKLTLTAGMLSGTLDTVGHIDHEQLVVAHLRGTKEGLMSLRSAIDQALARTASGKEGREDRLI